MKIWQRRLLVLATLLITFGLLLTGCEPITMYNEITITSPAFKNHETIPAKHSKDGGNISPFFKWGTLPEKTVSLALICVDSNNNGKEFVHWVIYNIPASATGLQEGIQHGKNLPDGSIQGLNSFGNLGYDGPQPPVGDDPHSYHFKLYALDTTLNLSGDVKKEHVINAITGHIIGVARISGTYYIPKPETEE